MSITRYSKRSATYGATTVCSSRNRGHTMTYWYWIQLGKRWVEFDIREVARDMGLELPPLEVLLPPGASQPGDFEALLVRDLNRVAEWCEKAGVITHLSAN